MAQCLINIHTRPLGAMIPVPVVIVKHLKKKSQASQGFSSSTFIRKWRQATLLSTNLCWGKFSEDAYWFLNYYGGCILKKQLFFFLLWAATLLITLRSVLSNERKMHVTFCNTSPFLILNTPNEYAVNKTLSLRAMAEFILPCRMQFRIVFAEIWARKKNNLP